MPTSRPCFIENGKGFKTLVAQLCLQQSTVYVSPNYLDKNSYFGGPKTRLISSSGSISSVWTYAEKLRSMWGSAQELPSIWTSAK